jgi:hypothetical protein
VGEGYFEFVKSLEADYPKTATRFAPSAMPASSCEIP